MRNLASMIHEQVKKYPDTRKALYYKDGDEWIGITWKEFGEYIDMAALGLLALGVEEKEHVGLFSGNRPEWSIADYAIMSVKGSNVSIYQTNTWEQAEYIVNDAGLKIIFVDDQDQYDKVMTFFDSNNTLTTVIVFDNEAKIDKSKNAMYL
ncbi:MAG: AMP-binding protein, partial [Syntrophomonadaceae bacterium]|nr:AMP-binding protein [Syntrophomonadaceae bacterium]